MKLDPIMVLWGAEAKRWEFEIPGIMERMAGDQVGSFRQSFRVGRKKLRFAPEDRSVR
jgi:hypothetical protein